MTSHREQLEQEAQALAQEAYGGETRFDFARRARLLARALEIRRTMDDHPGQVRVLLSLANTASNVADHIGALDYLHEAEQLADALRDPALSRQVRARMMATHLDLGDFETALRHATAEWESAAESEDAETRLMAINDLGCVQVEMGDHEAGIANIRLGMECLPSIAPGKRKTHLQAQSMADLANALVLQGNPAEALVCATQGAEFARAIDLRPLVALNLLYAGRAAIGLAEPGAAIRSLEQALEMASSMGLKTLQFQSHFELATAYGLLERHAEALANFRAAHTLEKATNRDEAFGRAEFLRARNEIEHARAARATAERVLFTVLPQVIATRIRDGEERIADEIQDASVLFADLVGFTALSTHTTPRDLLGLLEQVFAAFDQMTLRFQLEKIKTIGDAYMAVGGALVPAPDHLERCAGLAFAMLDAMDQIRTQTGAPLAIRIGLHAGPAIAGVIGTSRLSYDLWGETVNLASRLESSGMPGRVQVSASVADRLKQAYAIEPREAVILKGIGETRTFFLNLR